jgi:Skp family chaperone for outer membrane proteins
MSTRRLAILAFSAVAVAVVIGSSMGQSAPAPVASKICVCDVLRVLNGYQRAEDAKKDLERRAREVQTQRDEKKRAVETLRGELNALKEGSKEHEQRFNEVQRLELDLMTWAQFQQAVMEREHLKLTEEMYKEVLSAAEAAAKERSADIVLLMDPKDVKAASMDQMLEQIVRRRVLWASASIDISDAVAARLNDAYRATRPK